MFVIEKEITISICLLKLSVFILIIFFIAGCAPSEPLPTRVSLAVMPSPPPTPILATAVSPTSSPLPRTQPRIRIGADTAVPAEVAAITQQLVTKNATLFEWTTTTDADVLLTVQAGIPLINWVYVVAAPFATITDGMTYAELISMWQAEIQSPLLISDVDQLALSALFGNQTADLSVTSQSNLITQLWAERPSLTIIPFHRLTPELKVIHLDGMSPVDPTMIMIDYPLKLSIGVTGEETAVSTFLANWDGLATNRDPNKMTRVAMTGVTALVRATAYQMELNGISYPGTAVAPILNAADITHISNEVSFSPDCPYPNPLGGTTFCSHDSYLTLLKELGTDVIELTGNHLNDWGAGSFTHTIELYNQEGWQTFGGGNSAAEAAAPAQFTHHGNQIAFVGCNPVGPTYAWVSTDRGGSQPCHDDFLQQISALRDAGYVVIATQQYHEYYHYAPTAQQQIDFNALIDAGATAVSGSQAHHAQGFAFHNSGFIHYGLGNLFFDQMDSLGTRQTFVDTYLIYDGRLLNVSLWTGLIENYAQPREMTAEEREAVLTVVFQASGW
jgi:hypothetical protein